MGLFPEQVAWTEPWSFEYAKERWRQCAKELPSLWRVALWLIVLPAVAIAAIEMFLSVPAIERFHVGKYVLGMTGLLVAWPFVMAACPVRVHVLAKGVFFQVGNGGARIDAKNITSVSFETHAGKRYFCVRAKTPKGVPFERRALMPKKKVTEQDIVEFLYRADLAHLVRMGMTDDGTSSPREGRPD